MWSQIKKWLGYGSQDHQASAAGRNENHPSIYGWHPHYMHPQGPGLHASTYLNHSAAHDAAGNFYYPQPIHMPYQTWPMNVPPPYAPGEANNTYKLPVNTLPHGYPPPQAWHPAAPALGPAPLAFPAFPAPPPGQSLLPLPATQPNAVQPQAPAASHVNVQAAASLSYQWPDGNVRLECTEGEEPSGWTDEGWKWRSSGFRKGGVPEGAYKVDKRVCLGVMHCGCVRNGEPSRFFRPKTQKNARKRQLEEKCHICHDTFNHVECDATLVYYRYDDDVGRVRLVRHHQGNHNHPRPPINRLPVDDIQALDRQVRENPQASAQQLRIGAGPTQVPLGFINPILLNARKARTEVEKSKIRQGLQVPLNSRNNGFQLLESLSSLQKSFASPWIVKSDFLHKKFITMQTPFMADVLLKDSVRSWHAEELEVEGGRHGIITDGAHDFFKEGVLLSSVVFSQVLLRWVPVLYTWIGNMDAPHHKVHFDELICVIAKICTSGLKFTFDDKLFSVIMDYSNAQRLGFVEAFIDFMCSRIPGWNTLSTESRVLEISQLRAKALALIKGCVVHWKRSTHKIKQLVGVTHLYRFEYLLGLLEHHNTTADEFLDAAQKIRTEFPEVQGWISWWLLEGNGGMIFPAMQKMSPKLREKLPNSTNGGESSHWLLYRACGQNFDLWEGIRRLYMFQRETEMLYEAVIAGHVDAHFQGTKPQPISRIKWHPNDGRAPDTRALLASVNLAESAAQTRTLSLDDNEHFLACNSNSDPSRDGASHKFGDLSSNKPVEKLPANATLMSYRWNANSCYVDTVLELFYRGFLVLSEATRNEFARSVRTNVPTSGLRDVVEHIWLRAVLTGHIQPKAGPSRKQAAAAQITRIETALDAGQKNVFRWIENGWECAEDGPGQPGDPRIWFKKMITIGTNPRIHIFFGTRHSLNFSCGNHTSTKPSDYTSLETGVHGDDLFVAQQFLESDGSGPSLSTFLTHRIPRERFGLPASSSFAPLHIQHPSRACNIGGCDKVAELVSITTEWPLFFRFSPAWQGRGINDDYPDIKDVECPARVSLGPDVEYKLIGRVILIPESMESRSHFVAQIRIGDRVFLYDDLKRGGRLADLGPVYLLEESNPNTLYSLYVRTSIEARTTRTVFEINQDFALIPARLNAGSSAAAAIPVGLQGDKSESAVGTTGSNMKPDLNDSENDVTDILNNEIDQFHNSGAMLDKIYTPSPSPSPLPPSQPPATNLPVEDDPMGEEEPGTWNGHEPVSDLPPFPVHCYECGARGDGHNDSDQDQVQCERCECWSHRKCIGTDIDWDDPNIIFRCTGCKIREDTPQSIYVPGTIIMMKVNKTLLKSMWQPARMISFDPGRIDKEYEFDWLVDIVWGGKPPETKFWRSRKHVERLQDPVIEPHRVGKIRFPLSLKPTNDSDDSSSEAQFSSSSGILKDPQLLARLTAAIPQLAKLLLTFDPTSITFGSSSTSANAVLKSWIGWVKQYPSARRLEPEVAFSWMQSLPLVMESDHFSPLLSELLQHSTLAVLDGSVRNQLVMGPAVVFLRLIMIQYELDEDSSIDGVLLEEIEKHHVIVPSSSFTGQKALEVMWLGIDPPTIKDENSWTVSQLLQYQQKFTEDHVVYDPDMELPGYKRVHPSPPPVRVQVAGRPSETAQPSTQKRKRKIVLSTSEGTSRRSDRLRAKAE